MDQNTIRCIGCVQRRQGTFNGCLSTLFQDTVIILCPMHIKRRDIRQTINRDPCAIGRVGQGRIKCPVNKDQINTIQLTKHFAFFGVKDRGRGWLRGAQCCWIGIFPIFIATTWQSHGANARHGIGAHCRAPSFGLKIQSCKPFLRRSDLGLCKCCHYAISAKISA